MMDDFDIHINPDLDFELHKMPEVGAITKDAADQVAAVARANAPVESGRYASMIDVEKFSGGARVVARDQKSSWIEFGIPSHNQPARWVLRGAAEILGLKFKKGR